MLQLAGILLLVVLILVGALMPLRYTARLKLPRRPSEGEEHAQLPNRTPPRTRLDSDRSER